MVFSSIFGTIDKPVKYSNLTSGGLITFLNNIISLIITIAGLFVIVNFILAGYGYLSANGQAQKIADAGNKILQTVIGIAIIAAAYVIAAILGFILFKDPTALLKFNLFGFF